MLTNLFKFFTFSWVYIYFFIDIIFASFWLEKVNNELKWKENVDAFSAIEGIIIYFLWFLTLVWVIWIMKWGAWILTAWWDEERVKNGKKTVLYVIVWLLVIWVAWALISWIWWWLADIS